MDKGILAKFDDDFKLYCEQVNDFQKQLKHIMEEKNRKGGINDEKMTLERLAEKINLATVSVRRYSAGKNAPSMNTLVAICIVLQLDIKQSAALFESLGFCLLGPRREHYAYVFLLEHCRGYSIEECNKILSNLDIEKKYQLYPRKGRKDL